MNSFENPFARPAQDNLEEPSTERPSEVLEVPRSEHAATHQSESEPANPALREEMLRVLDLRQNAAEPEIIFDSSLADRVRSNPIARHLIEAFESRLSQTLSPENSPEQEELRDTVTSFLQSFGDTLLKGFADSQKTGDGSEDFEKLVLERCHPLKAGANERLNGKYNPLGGYFGKINIDADGQISHSPGEQDLARWSKAVLYNEPGVGAMSDVTVSGQEQSDVLQGYFMGDLANLAVSPKADEVQNIEQLLNLLSQTAQRPRQEIALGLAPIIAKVRNDLEQSGLGEQFDNVFWEIGLKWDQENHQYVISQEESV